MPETITIDFKKDMREFFAKELEHFRHETDENWDFDKLCIAYFNLRHRIISPKKREVLVSQELSCRSLTFDQELAIQEITNRSLNGESLVPYQSTLLIRNVEYNDPLLNHWGINHLHLGVEPHTEDPAFMARTGELLYCFVTSDIIYLLDVLTHRDFADPYLFEVLVKTCPSEAEKYEIKGISSGKNWNKEELKELRNAGVTALVTIDGVVYAPLGGGYACSGLSLNVRMATDRFVRYALDIEKYLKSNPEEIRGEMGQAVSNVPNKLEFRLYLEEEGIRVKEINSNVFLKFQG